MTDSGSIQHKQTFTAPSGFGFDDEGERVPIVEPDFRESETDEARADAKREKLEAFARLIAVLLRSDKEQLYRVVQCLGLQFRLADAAHSVAELAERLGVTRKHAYNILEKLHTQYPDLVGVFK